MLLLRHLHNYCVRTQSHQSHLTLCDPMDCSPPGSSVQGILQARILERVAMPSSRESTRPRNQTHISCVSCIAGEFFTHWATYFWIIKHKQGWCSRWQGQERRQILSGRVSADVMPTLSLNCPWFFLLKSPFRWALSWWTCIAVYLSSCLCLSFHLQDCYCFLCM